VSAHEVSDLELGHLTDLTTKYSLI